MDYVIEPSGATGFGQKFSVRHVNTEGESIQMFTALKLLGCETAFVAVAVQAYHIVD
nr:hypothetical protein [Phocaeicola sp.]